MIATGERFHKEKNNPSLSLFLLILHYLLTRQKDAKSTSEGHTENLTIGLSNTLNFILLLDGIGVRRTTGSIDDFIGETFGNSLDISEGSFSGT